MGTSMSIERTSSGGGGNGGSGSLQTLIEKQMSVVIPGGENKYVPIDVGHDRYEIRTIYVINSEQNLSVSTIFDKETGGSKVYQSLEEINTYDIVNVPCEDKDVTKTCHLFIKNTGGKSSNYTIIVKFTNLL